MRTRRYPVVFVVLAALALLAWAPAALAFPIVDAGPGLQPLGFMQSVAENPSTEVWYGGSVAYSGGVSVVGAPGRELYTGAAYINTQRLCRSADAGSAARQVRLASLSGGQWNPRGKADAGGGWAQRAL